MYVQLIYGRDVTCNCSIYTYYYIRLSCYNMFHYLPSLDVQWCHSCHSGIQAGCRQYIIKKYDHNTIPVFNTCTENICLRTRKYNCFDIQTFLVYYDSNHIVFLVELSLKKNHHFHNIMLNKLWLTWKIYCMLHPCYNDNTKILWILFSRIHAQERMHSSTYHVISLKQLWQSRTPSSVCTASLSISLQWGHTSPTLSETADAS